jgi:hypothetical protein
MGWTFQEYAETPARQVMELLEIWRLDSLHKRQK